ncbi:MAG TPA: YraN family protein [Candidatus Pacebacteria bacterium]|nr:YraN family protein [Candidatus Paceibacterota bacterium]HAX01536.1 YraN family protein [Candidatus Paceibacterota bacterium]
MQNKRALGFQAESLAASYLLSKKYSVLDRNVSSRYGEIDIIALNPNTSRIVCVEVKSSHVIESAYEAISHLKLLKMIKTWQQVQRGYPNLEVQIDAIIVQENCVVAHIENIALS